VTLANWRGVYGPPKMPEAAVSYWEDKLKEAMESPTWKKFAAANQWEPQYETDQEMQAYLAEANSNIKRGLAQIGALER
jgi:putative tricarboxylic transport membrane protein